jgi:tetratricopeptide (TPR) repeat protein
MKKVNFLPYVQASLHYWQEQLPQFEGIPTEQFILEHNNILTAVRYGLQNAHTYAQASQLALQSFPLIERWGHWQTCLPLLQQALNRCPQEASILRVQLLNRVAQLYRYQRQWEQAVKLHCQAKSIAAKLNDPLLLAESLFQLSEDYLQQYQYDLAETYGLQAAALLPAEAGHEKWRASILNTLGLIAWGNDQLQLAEERFRQAIPLWKESQQPVELARTLKNLGIVFQQQEAFDIALSLFNQAQAQLEGTKGELEKVRVKNSIGTLYFKQGHFQKAERMFAAAYTALLQKAGDLRTQASILHNLGNSLLKLAQADEAEVYLNHSATFWRQLKDDLELANTLGALGEAKAMQHYLPEARAFYDESLQLLSAFPHNPRAQRLQREFMAERDGLAEN